MNGLQGMARQDHQGILGLSNELLRDILDYIEADPEKLVTLDRRAYLSQESFRPPTFPPPDQAQDIGNFRLSCKRFAEVGSIHQYARVTTRFSSSGFERLRQIARSPHLTCHVKKFSYMVPYFYDADLTNELRTNRMGLSEFNLNHIIEKIKDQQAIRNQNKDLEGLRQAFSAFSALQHIQILRIQDAVDSTILRYLRQSHDQERAIEPRWPDACSHSTKTIARALLDSRSPCTRFSSPMLSTHSAGDIAGLFAKRPRENLSSSVGRLTSLELHFDDSVELDHKMQRLSALFKEFLGATENLQSIHIGFPSHYPLSLPLESLFHHVHWKNLIAFGIQAWKLDSDEIIQFVRRHNRKLRGLRLRDVLLKEGSRWRDVLVVLREELKCLEWVSLRRIGYAERFDEDMADIGIEIEDIPGGDSESSEDSDEDDRSTAASEVETYSTTMTDTDIDYDSDANVDENDENGPHANEMAFPLLLDDPKRWCECNGNSAPSADELGDEGDTVTNAQRKWWEKWCTRRCLHEEQRRGG